MFKIEGVAHCWIEDLDEEERKKEEEILDRVWDNTPAMTPEEREEYTKWMDEALSDW